MIKSKRGGGWSKQSSSERKKAAMPVLLLSQPLIPASPAAPSLNCTYKMTWFWIAHLNSFFHVCTIEHSKKSFLSQTLFLQFIRLVCVQYARCVIWPVCPTWSRVLTQDPFQLFAKFIFLILKRAPSPLVSKVQIQCSAACKTRANVQNHQWRPHSAVVMHQLRQWNLNGPATSICPH